MDKEYFTINLKINTYKKVNRIKTRMSKQYNRCVSYSEVIECMWEKWADHNDQH